MTEKIHSFYLKSNKRATEDSDTDKFFHVPNKRNLFLSIHFINSLIEFINSFNKICSYAHNKQHVIMTIIHIIIIIIISGPSWSSAAASCSRGFIFTRISRQENFTRGNKFLYLPLISSLSRFMRKRNHLFPHLHLRNSTTCGLLPG